MKQIAIYGASGFGREVLPLVRQQIAKSGASPTQIVFIDDNPVATMANGHPVMSYTRWLEQPAVLRQVVLAIANSTVREMLASRCEEDCIEFIEVKADNVVVMDEVKIGAGAILCPFVTLTSNISIGKQFHANIYSYVAHDCVIGDFVTFAPGVHCNGNVVIEDHAYIGAGAILRQGKPGEPLIIGRGAVVGMGAVVTKSVAPNTTVIGNPARIMQPGQK
jgi:sugar O-acyltransferase (sialic acid O-acetyltransferase NeuD family)